MELVSQLVKETLAGSYHLQQPVADSSKVPPSISGTMLAQYLAAGSRKAGQTGGRRSWCR